MSESALRNLLARVDGTAPSITAAASAMMKHYDRSAGVAVNEWRNALQTARPQEMLSLLYVANEVLQNSKRNRGNKFLEAMSPIIGQALQHICQADPSATEKVRRTVKIWAERRVFSVRFVNDLLQGLETFRDKPNQPPRTQPPANKASTFSPQTAEIADEPDDAGKDSDDDIMNLLKDSQTVESEEDDDSDDGDVFGGNDESEQQKLELDISIDTSSFKHASSSNTSPGHPAKRRRSSAGGASRKRNVQSISGILEILNRLSALQQAFERAQLTLKQIDQSIESKDASELAGLVGDELQKEFRQNTQQQQQIQLQRRLLHEIAQEEHTLEQDVARYLPWFESLMKQDDDDLDFCDRLEMKISSFQKIQPQIRRARDIRQAQERTKREKEAIEEEKRREKEEVDRFRQAALKRETEEKPGMVWNPVSREYQVIQTDESWRDH